MKTLSTVLFVMLFVGAGNALASDTSNNDKLLQAAMDNAEVYASPVHPEWGLLLLKAPIPVDFNKLSIVTPPHQPPTTDSDLLLKLGVEEVFSEMHHRNANIEPDGLFLSAIIPF